MTSAEAKSREANIAVLYPIVRAPFEQVFASVLTGISTPYKKEVLSYGLTKELDSKALQQWLSINHVDGVVALGYRGLKVLPLLPTQMSVVVGAVLLQSNDEAVMGVSMTPDPEKLFKQLRLLRPNIDVVHVVYLGDGSDLLVRQAQESAVHQGIKVNRYYVKDIVGAAQHYKAILKNINASDEAIWLVDGGRVLGSSLLSHVLEASWKDGLVVFSSKFSDVKRGILFSMYPNHQLMGERLGKLLKSLVQGEPKDPKILPATNLLVAINLRTAAHLGLHFSDFEVRSFGFVYP